MTSKLLTACALVVLGILSYSSADSEMVQCTTCRGGVGSVCLENPDSIPHKLSCKRCTNFARITKADHKLFELVRDCGNRVFPTPVPSEYENKCKDDNSHFIECTHSCHTGDFCNNNLTYAPAGWDEKGFVVTAGAGLTGGSGSSITFLFTMAVSSFLPILSKL